MNLLSFFIAGSGGRTRSARRSSLANRPKKKYDFTGLLDCIDTDEDENIPGESSVGEVAESRSKKRGRQATTSSEDDDSGDCPEENDEMKYSS